MHSGRVAAAVLVLAVSLAGCAGSISDPTAVEPLTTEQVSQLRLSDITADTAAGVYMSDDDLDTICAKVRTYIVEDSPSALDDTTAPGALKMKLHFTRFDSGDAPARFIQAGLGQIRIDADVMLIDSAGRTVAQYHVSKDFSFAGIYGWLTTVEDVEVGFEKSVAEVVRTRT